MTKQGAFGTFRKSDLIEQDISLIKCVSEKQSVIFKLKIKKKIINFKIWRKST